MTVADNKGHFNRVEKYVKEIQNLYFKAAEQAVALGIDLPLIKDKIFSFKDYPDLKYQVDSLFNELGSRMNLVISSGITNEWEEAYKTSDKLIEALSKRVPLTPEQLSKYNTRNLDALSAFQTRKMDGLALSDRVWKYTSHYKKEIELALDLGLGEAKSAAELSRQVKQYLQYPDKLFRRVRNKHGDLVLSKNARSFHPGQGVYRSSYKNAMRLTRTEINMAYRSADYERVQNLDFVVGIEVRRSNHVYACNVCEDLKGKYPKDFKFTGWHPHCRCHTITILASDNEFIEHQKKLLNGEKSKLVSSNEVKEVPSNFRTWLSENQQRIDNAKSLPFWYRDNKGLINRPTLKLDVVKARKPFKTDTEKEVIQKAWDKRKFKITRGKELADDILLKNFHLDDVDTTKLKSMIANKYTHYDDIFDEVQKLGLKVTSVELKIDDLGKVLINPMDDVKKFGLKKVQEAKEAIEMKLKNINQYDLVEQKKKLEFEVKWLENNKKHTTWEVAQKAYKKELDAVTYKLEKAEIESVISDALVYAKTAKSVIIKNLVKEYNDLLQANAPIHQLKVTASAINKKYKEYINSRNYNLRKAGKTKVTSGGLQELTTAEIDELLHAYINSDTIYEIDDIMRAETAKVWKTLTLKEKNILTKYTQTYSYLNEPLRGIQYYGSAKKTAEYMTDMPLLTSTLNKFELPKNMVVRRGVGNYQIDGLGCSLRDVKVGDIFDDKAFLSTGMHRGMGMNREINMVIVVPKGAKGAFAEPFSHYTDYHKFHYSDVLKNANLWDGVSKEYFGSEFEWIGQRGSKFKVIKKTGKTIILQLIDQQT